jgi:6-pyruvoyltetrahydropterin/6-carboxytetrahydropterin synthase
MRVNVSFNHEMPDGVKLEDAAAWFRYKLADDTGFNKLRERLGQGHPLLSADLMMDEDSLCISLAEPMVVSANRGSSVDGEVRLTKRFDFVASHALTGMEVSRGCEKPHAHNYGLELTLRAKHGLQNGLVIDSGRLKVDVAPVIARLSNRLLNEVEDPAPWAQRMAAQPSVENVALYFWEALGFLSKGNEFELVRVRVYEDQKMWAEVTGE